MSTGTVRVESLHGGGIVKVTIDRPPVNAINLALYDQIRTAFDGLRMSDGVRCAILTGAGERAFVAGSDINEFGELSPINAPVRAQIVRRAFASIRECEVPVIGAINGAALGAGVAVAGSCDMLVAAEEATFALPEIGVGVLGGTKHLSRLVPLPLMRRMALTGHKISARELAHYGALAAVVPRPQLMQEALRLAHDVAKHSAPALRLQKQTLNLVEDLGVAQGYQVEQMATGILSGTPESKAAVAGFREKASAAKS